MLVAIALVYTFRPFTTPVESAIPFPGTSGACRAAVLSAPGGGDEELELWAVTVGTDVMGFVRVFGGNAKFVLLGDGERSGVAGGGTLPDRFCATRARERLATAGVFVLGAGGVLFVALRRRPQVPA